MFSLRRGSTHTPLCCTGHPRHRIHPSLSVSDRRLRSRNTSGGRRLRNRMSPRRFHRRDMASKMSSVQVCLGVALFGTAGLFVFNENTFAEFGEQLSIVHGSGVAGIMAGSQVPALQYPPTMQELPCHCSKNKDSRPCGDSYRLPRYSGLPDRVSSQSPQGSPHRTSRWTGYSWPRERGCIPQIRILAGFKFRVSGH